MHNSSVSSNLFHNCWPCSGPGGQALWEKGAANLSGDVEGGLKHQKTREKAEIRKRRAEIRGPPRPRSRSLIQTKPSLFHWSQGLLQR